MSERNYYVLCDDNCKFPAMTAEQVLEAIAEATGNVPQHVDNAFITKIKEQNRNGQLKLWVGTEAQYNAIANPANDTLYIVTDSNTEPEIEGYFEDVIKPYIQNQNTTHFNDVVKPYIQTEEAKFTVDYIKSKGTSGIWQWRKWNSGRIELEGSTTYTVTDWEEWGAQYSALPGIFDLQFPSNLTITNIKSLNVETVLDNWNSTGGTELAGVTNTGIRHIYALRPILPEEGTVHVTAYISIVAV